VEEWRSRDEGAKPRGTVERLCAEYCALDQALDELTSPRQEGQTSGVDWGDDDDADEGDDGPYEDVVYENEFPPDHDD
jgi:hypothetical protein